MTVYLIDVSDDEYDEYLAGSIVLDKLQTGARAYDRPADLAVELLEADLAKGCEYPETCEYPIIIEGPDLDSLSFTKCVSVEEAVEEGYRAHLRPPQRSLEGWDILEMAHDDIEVQQLLRRFPDAFRQYNWYQNLRVLP